MIAQLVEWRRQRRQAMQGLLKLNARTDLLKRVRQTWIEDVLDKSLEKRVQTALGLDRWAEATPHSLIKRQQTGRDPDMRSTAVTVSQAFDKANGRLLILGPHGSGKTTALLELLHDLLDRADNDEEWPMPVVFNLTSWAQRCRPLEEWLIDELHHRYDVPLWTAKTWVNDDRVIMPLLDSLDEVAAEHRDRCVEEINRLFGDPSVGLIVCSCAEAYESLDNPLQLGDPFVVRPLTDQQVFDYFDVAGAQLAAVRDALRADPSLSARKLVQSPLMLNIVALTYQGETVLRAPSTVSELFTAYIKRMFKRRSLTAVSRQDRAIDWLGRLAQSMRRRSQREFDPGRLQPEWLGATWQRRLVVLAPVVLSGLIGGLLIGLLVQQSIDLISAVLEVFHPPIIGPRVGPNFPRVFALVSGAVLALVAMLGGQAYSWFGKLRRPGSAFFRRVVVLGVAGGGTLIIAWAYFAQAAGLLWLLSGVVLGRAYGLFRGRGAEGARLVIDPIERTYQRAPKRGVGPLSLRVAGVVFGLVGMRVAIQALDSRGGALLVLVIAVLVSELISELAPRLALVFADKRAMPNQQIRRSAGYSVTVGLVVGLVVWINFGLFYTAYFGSMVGQVSALNFGLGVGLGIGLLVGAVFGLVFGGIAFLRHFTLRALLAFHHEAPWRYIRFLDEMADRLFLYRSGGSYIFIHPLLLDHFAEVDHEPLGQRRMLPLAPWSASSAVKTRTRR
jgi:hypothetical protein